MCSKTTLFVFLVFLSVEGAARVKRYSAVPIHLCRAPQYYNCAQTLDCIHSQYRCDGTIDCPLFADDEADCGAWPCPEGAVKCSTTGQCIPQSLVCNGCEDCPAGDDERNCTSHYQGCRGNQFYCHLADTCIPVARTCDGAPDCACQNCTQTEDEDCLKHDHVDIYLSEDEPLYNLTVNLTGYQQDARIRAQDWTVHSDQVVYLRPTVVSLGEARCGPSTVWIYEGDQEAAILCGDTFPPWRRGYIASQPGSSFRIHFKYFKDLDDEQEDMFKGFSLTVWQLPE